jgi:hypothetical protein
VKPARHALAPDDRRRLPCEDQKSRLEGVLGLMRITEQTAADSQNHRTMALYQRRKCVLGRVIPADDEAIEQLLVALVTDDAATIKCAQFPEHTSGWYTAHQAASPVLTHPILLVGAAAEARP